MLAVRRITASWIWLLGLYSIASFIEAMFWGQMGSFTPLYLTRLGVAETDVARWTGLIVMFASAIGLPFLPLWGALADRYSRQPIIVRSFVAHLLAGIVSLLARNVWVFIIGRSIMSFALGNSGLMMTTLSERAPRHRTGLAFSIMNSATPIGAFVGPLLGGPIVDVYGFPTLLLIDSTAMLLVILAMTFGYRDNFKGTNRGSIPHMMADSVKLIWNSRRLRTLFPALFLLFGGWMMAATYVPLAVKQLYQGNDQNTAVGIVMGVGGLVTLVLSPIIGALADRIGHWRILTIGSTMMIILWPVPALTRDLTSFTIAWAFLNGMVSSVFALSFSVLSSSTTSEVRGRVMSFAYLPVNIGGLIGPAIGSVITPYSLFTVFPAAAIFTALGLGVLMIAKRQPMINPEIVPAPMSGA
jgi:MFS family permease